MDSLNNPQNYQSDTGMNKGRSNNRFFKYLPYLLIVIVLIIGGAAVWKIYGNPSNFSDKNSDGEQKNLNTQDSSKEKTNDNIAEIINLAISEKSQSSCDSISIEWQKERCYANVANVLQDDSLCEDLSESFIKNMCYFNIAQSSKDLIVCDSVTDEGIKAQCYVNIAIAKENLNICNDIPEGFEKWLLDFAAIGTIADMVPLKGENRIIVKYGLYVLAKTKNLGLKKLLEVSKIKAETLELFSDGKKDSVISVYSVGFQIAPRINSAGRIAHANMAVELFRSTSETEAKQLAMDLNLLNEDRKTLTEEVMKQVEQRLQNYGELFDRMNLIFEGDENWPSGILGIVAGRLMEKYYKPVILFQKKNHLNVASARSIKGFDLAKTIHSIKPYLEAGGGHAQAAGMSFQPNNTQQIKDIFKEEIEKSLNIDQMNPKLFIDAEISSNDISWKTYDSLVKLSPYGIANPEPIFIVKKMMIKNFELIGQDKNHIKVFFQPEVTAGLVTTYQAIGFNLSHLMEEIYEKDIVDIVFKLDVNEWNDKRDLQLNLLDMRKSDRR